MDKTEVIEIVNKKWDEFCEANPKYIKYLGGKIPHIAFCTFFRKNSYGNVKADCNYVIKTLSSIGIKDVNIATEYYKNVIYGNYPQTA